MKRPFAAGVTSQRNVATRSVGACSLLTPGHGRQATKIATIQQLTAECFMAASSGLDKPRCHFRNALQGDALQAGTIA
jgi:hypothetical protein